MSDRLATRHGPKREGAAVPLSSSISVLSGILIHPVVWPQQTWVENWGGGCGPLGSAGSVKRSLISATAEHLFAQVLSSTEMGDRLATIDMYRKEEAAVPLSGELGPHLIKCGLGRRLPPY